MIKLNVLKLLHEKCQSRYWLYTQLGMSCQNFGKMARNETKSISLKNIEAMCRILECTPNDLITVDLDQPESHLNT